MQAAREADRVELAGVTDLDLETARLAAEHYGADKVYGTPEQLIEDPGIDAVVLAVPTNVRLALALHALRCGKDILVEKPVAMKEEELHRLAAAQGNRTIAFCSSRFRFLEHAAAAARWIEEGHLGDIRLVRCRVNQPAGRKPEAPLPTWRVHRSINGGGIVANWGTYDLDYLLGLTGWTLKPRYVLGNAWGISESIADYWPAGADSESHGAMYIQCESGAVLAYERGEYMAAPREESWQIIGSAGSVTLKMTWPSEKIIVGTTLDPDGGAVTRTIWEGTEDDALIHSGPVFDFAGAILDNRPPATGLKEALVIQRIMDAFYRSAATGGPVAIQEEREAV